MTTVQKMKDAEKAILQDELEYYSRLLAAHYSKATPSLHPDVQSSRIRNCGNYTQGSFKATTDQPQNKSALFGYRTVITRAPHQNSKIIPSNVFHKSKSTACGHRTVITHAPNQSSKIIPSSTFLKKTDVHNKIVSNSFNFKKYPSKFSMVKVDQCALSNKSSTHAGKTLECNTLLKKKHAFSNNQMNPNMKKPSASRSQVLMDEINVLLEQLKQRSKNIDKTKHASTEVSSLKKGVLDKPELKTHIKISSDAKRSCYTLNCVSETNNKVNEENVLSRIDSLPMLSKDSNLCLLAGKREVFMGKQPNIVNPLKSLTDFKNNLLNQQKDGVEILSKPFSEPSRNVCVKVENPDGLHVQSTVKGPIKKKLTRKSTNSIKKIGSAMFASKYKVVNTNRTCVQQKKMVQISPKFKTPLKKKPGIKHVNSIKKMKGGTRLISTKYKIINKKLPSVQALNSENYFQGVSKESACELFTNTKGASLKANEIKTKNSSLNSKYKIVNKMGKSPILPVSSFAKQSINVKERKLVNFVHQGNKNLNQFSTNCFSNKNVYISSKLPGERKVFKNIALLKQNRVHVMNLKRKGHSHDLNSFIANSKYKTVNKQLSSSNKISKTKFSNLGSGQNSSMDMDLLMELAAEKKESNNMVTSSKHILMKRVYKSKNTIVNKNVSSLQTRAAKMIKTKYTILNKKHAWQSFSKSISPKCFKGHKFGNYQRKISFYHSQTNKRHISKYKNRHVSTYFGSSVYRRGYCFSKNRSFIVGSAQIFKTPKRFVSPRTLSLRNQSSMKFVSPISKTMANRALNRSINRVLTASVKKKTSKLNIYCMFYNRFGRCNNGVKCPYVHDPSKIAICTRFLRGTCKAKNCLFSHEKCPGKMAICSFFLLGSCTKTDCPYRHETLPPNAKLCKAFVQGYCPDGKQCKLAHVLVCPQFVQGHCEKGDTCPFPHPPSKRKKNVTNSSEKSENLKETEELTLEKMSRYFECASELETTDNFNVNSIAVQRIRNLPEQPSFIAL